MTQPSEREIVVEYKSEILGNNVFWRGPASEIETIRNIVARRLAAAVAGGKPKASYGMWTAYSEPSAGATNDE